MKMKDTLTFLLLGQTGEGKSATGNTLLNRKSFKASFKKTPKSDVVALSFGENEGCTLQVVDGPGLEDTLPNKFQDQEAIAKRMDTALAMCYGGVDAFILVIKFGNMFSAFETSALEALKVKLGNDYMNHVIVVVTGGDNFECVMEEEESDLSFYDWCRNQRGEFCQLFYKCEERFVLLNNREKDEYKKRAQVQELIQLTVRLTDRKGRYSCKPFKDIERRLERLIERRKLPQLTRNIQEKISLLTLQIEEQEKQLSSIEAIKIRIQDLLAEIEIQDRSFQSLLGVFFKYK